MKLQHLIFASLCSLAACGGGSKKPDSTPPPTTETTPPTETAATPPAEKAGPPAEAPAPPPPPPRFALGEAKIVMKLAASKKGASKTEMVTAEIVLAPDGALAATMTSNKNKDKKTVAGKLTVMGELQDDKGDVIARIDDTGKVEARQQMEVKEDGKVMKTETKYEDVGTLDDAGVFTNKKDGKKLSVDDKGKVTGFPAEMQFTVTAAPEQRKAAMFIIIGMFAASKMTADASNAKAGVSAPPAKK